MRSPADLWRATGADLPFGDPARAHGVASEGWYWRLADQERGRVVAAMVGFAHDAAGAPWANVVVAVHPEGIVHHAIVPGAAPAGSWPSAGDALVSTPRSLRIRLGAVELAVGHRPGRRLHQRLWGGLGPGHLVPFLAQHWTPLAAGAGEAELRLDGHRERLEPRVYVEKNWGRSFPRLGWWWGVAHAFEDRAVALAFAGGPLAAVGTRRPAATALVVRTPGALVRLGVPGLSPVRVHRTSGGMELRARTPRTRVRVTAEERGTAVALPHPEPPGRTLAWRARQELAADVELVVERRRGARWRVDVAARSPLAGLEQGAPAPG